MKATSKFQTNRYANADELIEDLDNISFVTNVAGPGLFENTDIEEKRKKRKQEIEKDIEEVVEARELERKRKKRKTIAIIRRTEVLPRRDLLRKDLFSAFRQSRRCSVR
jgi:hypothetical protein